MKSITFLRDLYGEANVAAVTSDTFRVLYYKINPESNTSGHDIGKEYLFQYYDAVSVFFIVATFITKVLFKHFLIHTAV